MTTDDKAAVLAANKAWYVALNAMFNGDPAPFADIYSHADDVSYMSAEGGLRVGWDATWKMVAHHADLLPNWIEVAGSALDA